jgi:hypothetical protein
MNTKSLLAPPLPRLALAGLLAGLVTSTQAFAQSYNEDEWYDPTDWFDGNNIEVDDAYDYLPYDFDHDYGFDDSYDYGTDWSRFDRWGTDNWRSDYYDSDYWDDFTWNDSSNAQSNKPQKSGQNNATDAEVYMFTIFAVPVSDNSSDSGSRSSSSKNQDGTANKTKASKSIQASQTVATLSGTIEGLRQMKLKQSSGATGSYTVANIRLDGGKNTIVNLGRSSQLKDLELKKGDPIQALGRAGKIAGKTVFVAHKLKSGGKTIDANPVIRLSDQQIAQQQDQKTIQGTVADVTQSTSRAQNKHTLLNVRLENGQSATVDLGPGASLDKIDLQEGEKVTIRGYTKQTEGREVLVPSLMKVQGQRISSVSE